MQSNTQIRKFSAWFADNDLHLYLDIIAWFVGCPFDEDDEGAILAGLRDTGADLDRWFDYPLIGEDCRLDMRFALDEPGSGMVSCEWECEEATGNRITEFFEVMRLLDDRCFLLPRRLYIEDVFVQSGRKIPVYRRRGLGGEYVP